MRRLTGTGLRALVLLAWSRWSSTATGSVPHREGFSSNVIGNTTNPASAPHSATASASSAFAPLAESNMRHHLKSNSAQKRKEGCSLVAARSTSHPPPRTILEVPTAYSSYQDVTPLSAFHETYEGIARGEKVNHACRVGGRITSMRDMGRILFITIRGEGITLQVIRHVDAGFSKVDLKKLKEQLRVGDIIGAEGCPGRTQKGELSLFANSLRILTPYACTDQIVCPDLKGFVPVSDAEVKYRYRFVDMMSNPGVLHNFRKRHAAIKALRAFLDDRGFVEVETPVLHEVASGANAKPFITHHNANEANLFLRVAPELHLKQCVVGGMDRVYEIGRVFRNEDADRSHNPEFTSCEFYAAYHTYEDLMPMTEGILRAMSKACNNGSTEVTVVSCVDQQPTTIDLARPFRRVRVYDEVQRVAGVELPPPTELNTPRGLAYMSAIMLRYNISLPTVRTGAKMFDKLIDFFITDRVVEPTFVMDHPLFMSPLAKEHPTTSGLSARFELFINGTEYCNAYSELNDPQEQYYRFQQQLLDRQSGDDEAMALDETFLKALQVGMPPTAGLGMGIDRVAMLLSGSSSIRDGILFPLLRQDTQSHDAKRRRKTASYFGLNYQMTLFCLNALEEEMIKRRAPPESYEKVRQLRRCILSMDSECTAAEAVAELARHSVTGGWRTEFSLAVLKLVCGRSHS